MNDYERKQGERRQRYEELAAKNDKEASRRFDTAHKIGDAIPFGQPILVGHHSEKHHRADVARIDNNMRAGVEASKKSDYYEQKAASVGQGGISSDDPDAIDKLREKLAGMEAQQAHMKAVNKIVKAKKPTDEQKIASLGEMGISTASAKKFLKGDFIGRTGYADFELTNNNANIRRVKERIAELEKRAAFQTRREEEAGTANKDIVVGDVIFRENADINRVQIIFPGKPDQTTRDLLSASGFRWSRTEGAWQRQLNGNGLYAAREILRKLSANVD